MSKFSERLDALGFATYEAYLRSPHWSGFKARYVAARLPRLCAVCSSKPIQLHHHTYERLGAEALADVTPLCREHHVQVHDWLKAEGKPVQATARIVKILRESVGTPAPAKPKAARLNPPNKARKKSRKAKKRQPVVTKRERKLLKLEAERRELAVRFAEAMQQFTPSASPLANSKAVADAADCEYARCVMRERLEAVRSHKATLSPATNKTG